MVEHLKKGNITYGRHLIDATLGGLHLILTGIVSIIHGLLPFTFQTYVAKTLITYYYRHFHNHVNPDFQELIKSEKHLAERYHSVTISPDFKMDNIK